MKYAVLNEDETIREFRQPVQPYLPGETGLLESGNAEVRPVEIDAEPVYNPAVEQLEPAYEVLLDKVLQHWTVVPRDPAVIAEEQRIDAIKASPDTVDLANRLKTATSAQIDAWIETNVTTLASARNVLKAIVKLLAYAVRKGL